MNKPQDKPAEATTLNRRRVFAGAGAVGALAAAAAAVPLVRQAPVQAVADAAVAEGALGGYQLTEHVEHYYRTARV
jgi:hypothetical protein